MLLRPGAPLGAAQRHSAIKPLRASVSTGARRLRPAFARQEGAETGAREQPETVEEQQREQPALAASQIVKRLVAAGVAAAALVSRMAGPEMYGSRAGAFSRARACTLCVRACQHGAGRKAKRTTCQESRSILSELLPLDVSKEIRTVRVQQPSKDTQHVPSQTAVPSWMDDGGHNPDCAQQVQLSHP